MYNVSNIYNDNIITWILPAEAEYADRKKKDMIIPLRVQEGYRSSGWLDLMAGGLLYIDFTKYDFDTAYLQLCQQIAVKGMGIHGQCIHYLTRAVYSPSSDPIKAVLAWFWILGSGFLGLSGHVQKTWQTDFDAISPTDHCYGLVVHAILWKKSMAPFMVFYGVSKKKFPSSVSGHLPSVSAHLMAQHKFSLEEFQFVQDPRFCERCQMKNWTLSVSPTTCPTMCPSGNCLYVCYLFIILVHRVR